jgi:flagellar hook-associated protein 2
MAGLQLSGLASGFDWKSFVDQIVSYERAPAARMQSDIAANQLKLTSLTGVENRVNDLRAAVKALNADDVFGARSAASASSGWSVSAGSTATSGSYLFEVTRRATAARWLGSDSIAAPLAPTNDVSGVTVATLGTATTPSAGVFTVNGKRVEVGLADSLQDVFASIASATGGEVSASYDVGADLVTLSGSGPIVLGSATDTSNLLAALRLSNNGGATITSSGRLGAVSTSSVLANARLANAVPAADAEGKGTFSINGVSIAYDLNADSLSALLARVNASAAGVSASFDAAANRVVLANNTTGDLGFSIDEPAGGLLAALGLTTGGGATLSRGQSALYSVNGGPSLASQTNTFTAETHGIDGLSVTPDSSASTSTVTVGVDTARGRARINTFISAFNSLQDYVESQTKVTSANGKVTTATLSDNREVQAWASQLRSAAFSSVPGLEGAIARLDHLGIDFTGTTSTLSIKDSAKLDAALRDRPAEVGAFFRQASTGLNARFETLFTSYVGTFGGAGLLGGQRTGLTNQNTSLTQQISDLDRRLEQRRAQLEAGFIAMERAQSTIQQMQSQLTRAFPTTSSK